jgi:hypothetical protein
MATKQVIVLSESSNGTDVNYTVLFWYPITLNPVSRSSGSVWAASGTSLGASSAENTAVLNGSIYEEVRSFTFPVGTPIAAIQSVLQQAWTKRNAQIAGQGGNQFYGSYFDGSVWSSQ